MPVAAAPIWFPTVNKISSGERVAHLFISDGLYPHKIELCFSVAVTATTRLAVGCHTLMLLACEGPFSVLISRNAFMVRSLVIAPLSLQGVFAAKEH